MQFIYNELHISAKESVGKKMFGEDEELKLLKAALKDAGCDADVIKRWSKQLLGIKKQMPAVVRRYEEAIMKLEEVSEYMQELKAMLSEKKYWDKGSLRDLQYIAKELKKIGTAYDHELVVSREDREFHLIYETIRRQIDKFEGANDARIYLLSEVENLSALIREKLARKKPNSIALTYFYSNYKEEELVDLPPEARILRIEQTAEQEFFGPIFAQLTGQRTENSDKIRALAQQVVGLLEG